MDRARFTYKIELDLADEPFVAVDSGLLQLDGQECDVVCHNDDGRTVQVTFDGDEEFTVFEDELEFLT